MEQTKKRGGRPPKQEPATARKKSPTIKRQIPDLDKQARLYECIDGSNFMRRLPTKNIQVYDEPSNSVRGIDMRLWRSLSTSTNSQKGL